jgi:hypothetical protein
MGDKELLQKEEGEVELLLPGGHPAGSPARCFFA